MDEKIITQFEVNVLVKDESTEAILRILKAHNAEVLAEKPVQKIRLSYDIKKQQYAFFVTFEISAPREEERGIRKDLSLNEQVIRLLITEKKEKKGAERRGIEAQKKPSRLKSALQAMLPNEALEKKISVGALMKQLYLEVDALTMSVNGYTSDRETHTDCSEASTCIGGASVIMGQTTARETKFGVRYDLEGVAVTTDDLRAHLDVEARTIESVTADYEGEYVTVRYSYSGFGFDAIASEEIEYEELPDDDAHRTCIPRAIEAFAERLAEFTLYDEGNALPPEIVENNRKIINAISEYKKACHAILNDNNPFCYDASPRVVAMDVYKKMLTGKDIYTMTAAKKANFNFRLSEALIPTEPLPEKPKPKAGSWETPISRTTVSPKFGTNVGSLLNGLPPACAGMAQAGAPMPIKHMNGS